METTFGKITFFIVIAASVVFGIVLFTFWHVDTVLPQQEPQLHIEMVDVRGVSAKSYVVFDFATGATIMEKDATAVLPIASVTKLVTAAMVLESQNNDATTSIQWSDIITEGGAGKLKHSDIYSRTDLLYPLLLESSNDAAAALMRTTPQLLESMNSFATAQGLSKSKFFDTSGLSGQNVSTATELSIVARTIFENYPHVFDITRLGQFIGVYTGWRNNNPLVQEEGYRGGKHGYTDEANRTAVAFFDEKFESGHTATLGYVVLGSDTIKKDIEILRAEIHKKMRFE